MLVTGRWEELMREEAVSLEKERRNEERRKTKECRTVRVTTAPTASPPTTKNGHGIGLKKSAPTASKATPNQINVQNTVSNRSDNERYACPVRGCKKDYQSLKRLRTHILKDHPTSLAGKVIAEESGQLPATKRLKKKPAPTATTSRRQTQKEDQPKIVAVPHTVVEAVQSVNPCPTRSKQREALAERISIQKNNNCANDTRIQDLFSSAMLDFVSDFLAVNNLPPKTFQVGSLVHLQKACALSFPEQQVPDPTLPTMFETSEYKALAGLLWEQMASKEREI